MIDNKMMPLKLSDIDNKLFEKSIFTDFKDAFSGTQTYKLADVPLKY